MPDTIGRISVPEVAASGVFPIASDRPHGKAIAPRVHEHRFGSANAKIEQSYYEGPGLTTYRVMRRVMGPGERAALAAFMDARVGPYQPFTYNAPGDGWGAATTPVQVRFREPVLTMEHLAGGLASASIVLVEDPVVFPSYTTAATIERFPDGTMESELANQVQEFIPLVKIRVKEAAVPDIFLSSRRVTVNGQLYQARLLRTEGISQQIGGAPDRADFTFGNADRVMQALAADTELQWARIEFSYLHVNTLIKLDLWAGEIASWRKNGLTEFTIGAQDPAADINLIYPPRALSRFCYKPFDQDACPASSAGGSNLGDPCDKGFDTAQGCVYHTMEDYFGGVEPQQQLAHIKDNSQGRWGFGRPRIPVSSIQSDTIYGQALREIYTDGVEVTLNCPLVAFRDESDFLAGLFIVGAGPIGAYATPVFPVGDNFGDPKFRMDNQPWHGFKDGGYLGLHANSETPSLGPDPNETPFAIDYDPLSERRAAGTAFFFIRIADVPGIQLTRLQDHSGSCKVSEGLSGWTWSGPGARSSAVLANPIWIAVRAYLLARGLHFATAADQEAELDIAACVAAAGICDTSVPKLVGSGSVNQFIATGVIEQRQPLRNWLQDTLNNCLGDFTFRFGKFRPFVRVNSSAVEAFTRGNVIWNSIDAVPAPPEFNHLIVHFANQDTEFSADYVEFYDEDHALQVGRGVDQVRLTKEITLALTGTRDQALRLLIPRLREELGGITPADWRRRRRFSFQTTLLGLTVDPGMVISLEDGDFTSAAGGSNVGDGTLSAIEFSGPALPGGYTLTITAASPGAGDFEVRDPNDDVVGTGTVGVEFEGGGLRFTLAAGGVDFAVDDEFTITMTENEVPGGRMEGRVQAWRLNSDFSVSVECMTTTDEMYDTTVGPKPHDVEPDAVPEEVTGIPQQPQVIAVALRDGYFRLYPSFPTYEAAERMTSAFKWGIFWVNELEPNLTLLTANIDNAATIFDLDDASGLVAGNWFQIGSEVFFVTDVSTNTVTVLRGEKGSAALAHTAGDKVWLINLATRFSSFPINSFTGLPGSLGDNFEAAFLLPSAKVVAYEVEAVNPRGNSPLKTYGSSFLLGTGIRTFSGLTMVFVAAGSQDGGASEDIAPPGSTFSVKTSIGVIVARLKNTLSGGSTTYAVNVAGVEVGQVTIDDGESEGTLNGIDTTTGDLLGVIDIDQIVTIDRVSGAGGGTDLELQVRC